MTKTLDDINFDTWFIERELNMTPPHFTLTSTPITNESRIWVLEKLRGRFAIKPSTFSSIGGPYQVAFEDPKEAVFYELTWG